MTHTHYEFLSGIGLDVHAFSPKNNSKNQIILLCGIPISHFASIMAHSDGDVGLHAITDAILGAIGAGDIGEHFPPQDAKWKNKDSVHFVQYALQLCHEKNANLVNVDITIICEKPNMRAHKKAMQENIAHLLCLPMTRVNIKATTTEKLGFLGRKEGIAVLAIVSIKIPLLEPCKS